MSNLPKEIPLRKGTFSPDYLVAVFPAEILAALIRRDPECSRQFAAAIAAHRAEGTALMDARLLAWGLALLIDSTGIAEAALGSAEKPCFELFFAGHVEGRCFRVRTSTAMPATRSNSIWPPAHGRTLPMARILVKRAALAQYLADRKR